MDGMERYDWVEEGGPFLLFSDIPGNAIIKWTPDGEVSDFLRPVYEGDHEGGGLSGSNGITVGPNGDIVFTEHFGGRISRVSADGTRSVVVDTYEGGRFSSPNDLAYHTNGSLYFTDPPYGLPSPEDRAQDVNGIYRLDPDGTVTLLADLQGPNGIALSPDESRLYVADSSAGFWMVYDVAEDGSLNNGVVLLDASDVDAVPLGQGCQHGHIGDVSLLDMVGPEQVGHQRRASALGSGQDQAHGLH